MITHEERKESIKNRLNLFMRRNQDVANETGIHEVTLSRFLNHNDSLGPKKLDILEKWLEDQEASIQIISAS